MRVGLVCPYSLTLPGGVQGQVLGLGRALRDLGIDARVLGPCDGPPPDTFVTPLGNSIPTAANGSMAAIAPDPARVPAHHPGPPRRALRRGAPARAAGARPDPDRPGVQRPSPGRDVPPGRRELRGTGPSVRWAPGPPGTWRCGRRCRRRPGRRWPRRPRRHLRAGLERHRRRAVIRDAAPWPTEGPTITVHRPARAPQGPGGADRGLRPPRP